GRRLIPVADHDRVARGDRTRRDDRGGLEPEIAGKGKARAGRPADRRADRDGDIGRPDGVHPEPLDDLDPILRAVEELHERAVAGAVDGGLDLGDPEELVLQVAPLEPIALEDEAWRGKFGVLADQLVD